MAKIGVEPGTYKIKVKGFMQKKRVAPETYNKSERFHAKIWAAPGTYTTKVSDKTLENEVQFFL